MLKEQNKIRCTWVGQNPLMIKYHDTEWGVPLHNDRKLFEFFVLDTFQAGLSWEIILKKREGFKNAFKNFNIRQVASFNGQEIEKLLRNENIIRNRMKVEATVNNAKKFLEIKKEFGSFDKYIWQFTNYGIIKNSYKKDSQIPPFIAQSEIMSKDLKNRGFKFVGPIICYAFMQGIGMVNDHLVTCFCYNKL